jgi:hypothetical protein
MAIQNDDKTSVSSRITFFEKLLSKNNNNNSSKNEISSAHEAATQYMSRQDKRLEEKLLLRRIANNTDSIIDLLKDFDANKKKDSKSLADLLKFLPGLAAVLGLLAGGSGKNELVKPVQTVLKAANAAAHAAHAAALAAKASADATKAASLTAKGINAGAKASEAAAKAAGDGSRIAKLSGLLKVGEDGTHTLSTAAKVLGKVGNSKILNRAVVGSSIGMGAYRAATGDYLGAGMEGASLGMHLASKKVSNPKAKLALIAGSAITDGAIIARDYFNRKDNDKTTIVPASQMSNHIPEQENNNSGLNWTGALGGTALTGAIVAGAMTKGKSLNIGGKSVTLSRASIAAAPSIAPTITREAMVDAGKVGLKSAVKIGSKVLPGVGLAMGAYGAYSRGKEGDYVGALGEAVSGLVGLVPGLGTAASIAIQGGLLARDLNKANIHSAAEMNSTVKKSNAAMLQSSNSVASNIKKTDDSLSSFTKSFGDSLSGWLSGATSIFTTVFATLTNISGTIANLVANGIQGLKNGAAGLFNTQGPNSSDINVDTGKGEYTLGKLGGTMTSAIMAGESHGNYGAANVRQANGKYKPISMNNTNYSIGQITSMQKNKQINAFGAYQMLSSTIEAGANKLGISKDTKMTAAVQDKIYQDYIIKDKRKAIYEYITGKSDNLGRAIIAGAQEWAAIGVPSDFRRADGKWVKKGQSYYVGIGGNNASVSPEVFGAGLKKQREVYQKLIKEGYKPDEAYHKSFNTKDYTVKSALGGAVGLIEKAIKGDSSAKDTAAIGQNKGTNTGHKAAQSSAPVGTNTVLASSGQKMHGLTDGLDPKTGKITGSSTSGVLKPDAAQHAKAQSKAKDVDHTSTSSKTKNKNAGVSATWDLDKLCSVAYANAAKNKKPTGFCARYITMALQKAQNKKVLNGTLGHARDYVTGLPKIGWRAIGKNLKSVQKGDIAVFPKSSSEYGHVCVFTGSVWVSDFVQNQVQPNSRSSYDYYVYRAISGVTNGTAVGAPASDLDVSNDIKAGNATAVGGASDSVDATAAKDGSMDLSKAIDTAITAAVDGVAAIADAVGKSDFAISAMKFVNDQKVEPFKATHADTVNMAGFYRQNKKGVAQDRHKYAFGEGGGVDEDNLFKPNLDRQNDIDSGALSRYGYVNGRQTDFDSGALGRYGNVDASTRQLDIDPYALNNAGYISPDTRQNDYSGKSSTSTSKKKKKWYEKIFGSKEYAGVKSIASIFGLGDYFDDAETIYNNTENKTWGKWGLNKAHEYANKNGLGGIWNEGQSIFNASQSGDWWGYGLNKAQGLARDIQKERTNYDNISKLPYITGNDFKVLTGDNTSISSSNFDPTQFSVDRALSTNPDSNSQLKANVEERNKVDGYVSMVNKQYNDSMKTTPTSSPDALDISSASRPSSIKPGMAGDGLQSDIITRNPDSIFRAVSITMMKASIT